MAIVRTAIDLIGRHHSAGRLFALTLGNVRHWIEQFQAMRRQGIKIPCPWGHQLNALPHDPLLDNPSGFASSRFNAGEVVGLTESHDGKLVATIDAPGVSVEGGRLLSTATPPGTSIPVRTAISEVSPFITPGWTDGAGRLWQNVLAHIALVVRPVVGGQAGFTTLATAAASRGPPCGCYLSTRPPEVLGPWRMSDRDLATYVSPTALRHAHRNGHH